MKVVNIALSILIFLLAAASAVFSWFLFEKREIMVKGWEKLSVAINQAATEQDKNSGTKNGEALTVEELSHEKYDTLEGKLVTFVDSTKLLMKQRDDLSIAMREVAKLIETDNVATEQAFTELASYSANKDDVLARVREFKQRRDRLVSSVISTSRRAGVSLNAEDLRRGDTAAFAKFDAKIAEIMGQFNAYQAMVRDVARTSGAPSPNFSASALNGSLSAVQRSVLEMKRALDQARVDLSNRQREITGLNEKVASRDNQIGTMSASLKHSEARVNQLKQILGTGGAELPEVWEPGSKETRGALRGKVSKVNDEYGFIVLDIGKKTLVPQDLGNGHLNKVDPLLANNMEMVVARDMDSSNAKFVSRIKLSNVTDDCTIAEALPGGKEIKVGDTVYFDPKDIPNLK